MGRGGNERVAAEHYPSRPVSYFAATRVPRADRRNSNSLIHMELLIRLSIESYFNKPELLATLHRHQKGLSSRGGVTGIQKLTPHL